MMTKTDDQLLSTPPARCASNQRQIWAELMKTRGFWRSKGTLMAAALTTFAAVGTASGCSDAFTCSDTRTCDSPATGGVSSSNGGSAGAEAGGGGTAGRVGGAAGKANGGAAGSVASSGGNGGPMIEGGSAGAVSQTGGGQAGSATGGTGTGGANSGGTTSGGAATSDGTAVGALNQPCSQEGATACQGHRQKLQLVCSGGKWTALNSCSGSSNCDTTPGQDAGSCQPILAGCSGRQPGTHMCSDDAKSVLACGVDLVTTSVADSCSGATPACLNGTCVACTPQTTRCSGTLLQTCTASGTWGTAEACPTATPVCSANACGAPPSCAGLASNCGASGTDSCCSSPVVPGGTYNRSNDASYPATVSDFRLDTYEITVGRFKKFVAAYSQTMIAAGAGKNPNNPSDGGWDSAWNVSLPKDAGELATVIQCDSSYQTWSAGNERLPMNCISWFEAEAFCIWDGGRLPTEAEWNYAAAGGSEQRSYPWGATAPAADASLAIYGCNYPSGGGACSGSTANIATVGIVSAGNGKWGQADLGGGLTEWTQDSYFSSYVSPCNNCANLNLSQYRVIRGGSFMDDVSYLLSSNRSTTTYASYSSKNVGARCARAQ